MITLIPNRFLFDFAFPLRYRPDAPTIDGSLGGWTDAERLPDLSELDGRKPFAEVWACWNEGGLFVACRAGGKRQGLRCDPKRFWSGDNLRLCVDWRDTRNVKRATRFCQQFYFLPTGGGPKRNRPVAGTNRFQRAQADAPAVDAGRIRIASRIEANGYAMEAHVPATCLAGFDPAEHPRIGFYYMLEDSDHGQQYMTVGDDLYWYVDPSTWSTAILER